MLFKKKIAVEKLSEETKRYKITDYIAKQNSRQEILSLLGFYIDKTHVELLHLKKQSLVVRPGRGHCVVFLGKTHNSHCAPLHPGV